jgi:hypothetical protein
VPGERHSRWGGLRSAVEVSRGVTRNSNE